MNRLTARIPPVIQLEVMKHLDRARDLSSPISKYHYSSTHSKCTKANIMEGYLQAIKLRLASNNLIPKVSLAVHFRHLQEPQRNMSELVGDVRLALDGYKESHYNNIKGRLPDSLPILGIILEFHLDVDEIMSSYVSTAGEQMEDLFLPIARYPTHSISQISSFSKYQLSQTEKSHFQSATIMFESYYYAFFITRKYYSLKVSIVENC